MKKWTSKFAISFMPLPKEKEIQYFAALAWFAKRIIEYMQQEALIEDLEVTKKTNKQSAFHPME